MRLESWPTLIIISYNSLKYWHQFHLHAANDIQLCFMVGCSVVSAKLPNTSSLSSLGPWVRSPVQRQKTSFNSLVINGENLHNYILQAAFITEISPVSLFLWVFCLFNSFSLIYTCTIYAIPAEWDRTYSLSCNRNNKNGY